jgi:hypothetical protein
MTRKILKKSLSGTKLLLRRLLPRSVHSTARSFAKAVLPSALFDKEVGAAPPIVDRDSIADFLDPFIGCDLGGASQASESTPNRKEGGGRVPCKLVLCCAFLGRHDILRAIVEESLSSDEGKHVGWMLAGSTKEDYQLIQSLADKHPRIAGFTVPNDPLGQKWQACVYHALQHFEAPLYGITGSDDVVSRKLIDHIIERDLRNKEAALNRHLVPSMYGTMEWLICQTPGPQITRCCYSIRKLFQPLGAGRFYTQEFLKACGGKIFESAKSRHLDDRGFIEATRRGAIFEYYTVEDGAIISVKGGWKQLNGVAKIIDSNQVEMEEFTFFGQDLVRGMVSEETFNLLIEGPVEEGDPPIS